MVHKACACVVVDQQILAFKHPRAGYQLPKGSVEEGESFEAAALRELEEESGISTGVILEKVGTLDWLIRAGTATFKHDEQQRWHLFLIDPGKALPRNWQHQAEGSEAERGLIFEYFWQSLESIPNAFHPVYCEVMLKVKNHIS